MIDTRSRSVWRGNGGKTADTHDRCEVFLSGLGKEGEISSGRNERQAGEIRREERVDARQSARRGTWGKREGKMRAHGEIWDMGDGAQALPGQSRLDKGIGGSTVSTGQCGERGGGGLSLLTLSGFSPHAPMPCTELSVPCWQST